MRRVFRRAFGQPRLAIRRKVRAEAALCSTDPPRLELIAIPSGLAIVSQKVGEMTFLS
jgi:hypothetical protein